MAELDVALDVPQLVDAGAVDDVLLGVQQLADTLEGSAAPAGHVNQLRYRHDRPDDGVEVADELHQLSGVEVAPVHQIAAVAQDDADDGLHKQRHQDAQKHRGTGEIHVGSLVLLVELLEGQQLLGLLDKGLDDGDAGEALLGEVAELGKGLLADIPLLAHILPNHRAGGQQQRHGDHGKDRHQRIHVPHFDDCQHAQEQRVEEHEDAGAVAVLHGLQIVGEQAHEAAHLVLLVELTGEILGVGEHLVAQVGLHLDGRAEDAHAPQKTAHHHGQHDPDHRHTNPVQQKVHVKGHLYAVHHDPALVHAIDYHLVQIGRDELHVVHHNQRRQPQQQPSGVFYVVFVDVFPENHTVFTHYPFLKFTGLNFFPDSLSLRCPSVNNTL